MSSEAEIENINSYITEIRDTILPCQNIEYDKSSYVVTHLHLSKLYFALKDYLKAVYHLSECHGVLLRHHAILEDIRRQGCFRVQVPSSSLKWVYISSTSDYAQEEDKGLLRRLTEMPSEWTVVQLTRIPSDDDDKIPKSSNPKLKELFISRMSCGHNPDEIQVGYIRLPQDGCNDILDLIHKSKNLLKSTGLHRNIIRIRSKASKTIQNLISNSIEQHFTDWNCVFRGKLQNKELENQVRGKIDDVLEKFSDKLPSQVKHFLYLLAEASHFLTPILIRSSLENILPSNKRLKNEVYEKIIAVKECCDELKTARRHPVILIVEEHLECIPWESMSILKDQPVTRMPSIHFLHALFKSHEDKINFGLREIDDNRINYYIVNPDGNLPNSEAKLKPFFEKRCPSWKGLIGKKPSVEAMKEALTTSNSYIYCGHGSGSQFINSFDVQRLNLENSIQLIFGCQSADLKYLGGTIPMSGDMLSYCIAGSPCSLGMLYTCTSDDVDEMTMYLANLWLPGTPINYKSLKLLSDVEREPELQRILPKVREIPALFSNGAALISRGLPVKLVPSKSETN